MTKSENKFEQYPKTENFEVIDIVGVPHPYCITPKHVAFASDRYCGRLGEEAIKALEKKEGNPCCGTKGCNLKYEQHEQALVVHCKTKDKDQLQEYLLSIKGQCEKDGYAGFVLVDGTEEVVGREGVEPSKA